MPVSLAGDGVSVAVLLLPDEQAVSAARSSAAVVMVARVRMVVPLGGVAGGMVPWGRGRPPPWGISAGACDQSATGV
ncbi:hypothetical protein Saso_27160 [Streptomyces asoensis]|uniref:Uncharacterized protein n=1 Tax=Streptomyces asoensis TaxID=249586 RepID=A0ABQ3RZ11_9ACTN|nr:hypothetical protein GCM10010496_08740 [Streptomyces asoensis]GHI61066.1 hypothetical protein Saso_27160 [Streptomyces asoensis]